MRSMELRARGDTCLLARAHLGRLPGGAIATNGRAGGTGATGDGTGSKPKRVAVDVGGTFTDVCVFDQETGVVTVAKTPSTPDPIDGVCAESRARRSASARSRCSRTTTVATNAR